MNTLSESINVYPYLQNVTKDSITIMWETNEPTIGTVNYGESKELGKSLSDQSPQKIHEIKITGLDAGKLYYYQVSYNDTKLPISFFKTSPPDMTKTFRLAVYGDSRSNITNHSKVAKLILDSNPDLIINTGDLVTNGDVYEQWKNEFFMPLRDVIDHIPIYTCIGNHERNSPNYYNYLSLPNNESYYSFDYANAHFICLNTISELYDESSPQYKWLIDDLEKNKDGKWIIVFFHSPLFRAHRTRGIEPQRYVWQPIFDKYGVDIVLNGHDHNYTRIYPVGYLSDKPKKGVQHIITGGGGAPLYDIAEGRSYVQASNKVHHSITMDFDGDNMTAVVKDIEGNIIDRFEIDRTKTTKPNEYVAYEMFELERELRKAIDKLVPVIADKEIKINTSITVKTNFPIKLKGTMSWNSDTKWKINPISNNFELDPREDLLIPIQAEVD
ncbi:MAG: purple acid phosphatase family protein, partial [Candidatus Poribacteria bacterium]